MTDRHYLNLQVNPCQPQDEVECASDAEIDRFFSTNVFQVLTLTNFIDMQEVRPGGDIVKKAVQ